MLIPGELKSLIKFAIDYHYDLLNILNISFTMIESYSISNLIHKDLLYAILSTLPKL